MSAPHRDEAFKVYRYIIDELKERLPFKIGRIPLEININNYNDVIAGFDIILHCTDNFAVKFLLNDIAVLNKKILIQASIRPFTNLVSD